MRVGEEDLVMVVLDTLRFDVAHEEWAEGRTPNLAALLPESGWERRHAPGTFTFASISAFLAGFLPTPARPGRHPRRFALRSITMNSAYELHQDRRTGSLERGNLADLIVLDRNVLRIPKTQIMNTKVLLTMVGGKAVYGGQRFR